MAWNQQSRKVQFLKKMLSSDLVNGLPSRVVAASFAVFFSIPDSAKTAGTRNRNGGLIHRNPPGYEADAKKVVQGVAWSGGVVLLLDRRNGIVPA